MSDLRIAIIGAGVIGTSTALELQKRFRNAKIEIFADKFYDQTTSYVAAGIFRPGTSFQGPNEQITLKWIQDSYHYWNELRQSIEGLKAGVTEISGYQFSSNFPNIVKNHYLEKLLPIYRSVTEEELKLCPGNWKYGSFYTTIVTQSSYYIPWALDKFLENDGVITDRQVKYLEEFANTKYDVIVNCSGLGSRELCNDYKLVPIRGQVIKVKAPWIKTFFYGDLDTYIIPGIDAVTLGGCRQYESWDVNVNKYDSLKIKEQCESLVPSLKGAELLGYKVGLRPHRDVVRVEKEIRDVDGQKLKIVHNYGHGGYGVTTAPGTSIYATDLVYEILAGNSKL